MQLLGEGGLLCVTTSLLRVVEQDSPTPSEGPNSAPMVQDLQKSDSDNALKPAEWNWRAVVDCRLEELGWWCSCRWLWDCLVTEVCRVEGSGADSFDTQGSLC